MLGTAVHNLSEVNFVKKPVAAAFPASQLHPTDKAIDVMCLQLYLLEIPFSL